MTSCGRCGTRERAAADHAFALSRASPAPATPLQYGMSYVIRAHQAVEMGVGISQSAFVITVFSTSKDHNCGAQATCGCLLVHNGTILPIAKLPHHGWTSPTQPARGGGMAV